MDHHGAAFNFGLPTHTSGASGSAPQPCDTFSPDSPFFPFSANSKPQRQGGKVLKDGMGSDIGRWYPDEFGHSSNHFGMPKTDTTNMAPGGNTAYHDPYFLQETGVADGNNSDWQAYAYGAPHQGFPQAVPHLDGMIYGNLEQSAGSSYGSNPGTPPVSSPAPYVTMRGAPPVGADSSNLDDAINVLHNHAAPDFGNPSHPQLTGVDSPSHGANNGGFGGAMVDTLGGYQVQQSSDLSSSVVGTSKKRKAEEDLKPSSSIGRGSSKRGKRSRKGSEAAGIYF
jgi:hypothetical protein